MRGMMRAYEPTSGSVPRRASNDSSSLCMVGSTVRSAKGSSASPFVITVHNTGDYYSSDFVRPCLRQTEVLLLRHIELAFDKLGEDPVEFVGMVNEGVFRTEDLSRLVIDQLDMLRFQLFHGLCKIIYSV
jgi:hypothetical protein